jgi:hypothetical protein
VLAEQLEYFAQSFGMTQITETSWMNFLADPMAHRIAHFWLTLYSSIFPQQQPKILSQQSFYILLPKG